MDQDTETPKPSTKPHVHWRAYAAIAAVLAGVVAFTNGINALSQFPTSISNLQQRIWPKPVKPPLSLVIAQEAARPPPGHKVIDVATIGRVFGSGADIRLVMQASGTDRIAQVVKLATKVKRVSVPANVTLNDTVDPLAQPGFGAARPETFLITVRGEAGGSARYVRDLAHADEAHYPDLLPADPPLVYRFGGQDGAQETIDLKLRLQSSGVYEVRFVATVVAEDKEYVVESPPVLVGRK
jgi:hypothetical protein